MFNVDKLYNIESEIDELKYFLLNENFIYNSADVDVSYVIRNNNKIIATVSVKDNIIKYFCIDDNYRGEGLSKILFNAAYDYLFEKNISKFFIFTKPENEKIFKDLAMKEVIRTDKVLLLENAGNTIDDWLNMVKKETDSNIHGCIVMNANPITKGHEYLVKEALKKIDKLIVFVLEEDKSFFSFKDRFHMVKSVLSKYKNVKVIKGGPYIISNATFPTYFLKKNDDFLEIYEELDAKIFCEKIAPELNIKMRFFGSEEEDMVTNMYNKIVKKVFEKYKVEAIFIDRLKINAKIVSASKVREMIKKGKLKEAEDYISIETYNYLMERRNVYVDNS